MAVDNASRQQGKCAFIKKDGAPCGKPAGAGTAHKGEGCCKLHGGNGGRPAINGKYLGEGKYKRYDVIKAPRLRELGEHFEADPDPLNLLPEVILLRALITDFAERYEEATNALIAWHASFGKEALAAERLWLAEVVTELKRAVQEELSWEDDRKPDEILEELNIRDRAYPPDYAIKPRQVIDILQVGRFIADIGLLADKIQKQRENGAVSLLEVNAFWKLLGFEMVRAVREVAGDDEDLCARLIGAVQRRWNAISPPGAAAAA